MAFQAQTRAFLTFLQSNPGVRDQIRAAPGKTLLYAGSFFKPVWREIAEYKRSQPQLADKQTLPDVLALIRVPGTPYPSLLAYVQDVESKVPWNPDGFTLWRALSGLFAANAVGAVSFSIGSGVTGAKVFAATEAMVLARNPQVDPVTKDMVAYYLSCIKNKQVNINAGFISA